MGAMSAHLSFTMPNDTRSIIMYIYTMTTNLKVNASSAYLTSKPYIIWATYPMQSIPRITAM